MSTSPSLSLSSIGSVQPDFSADSPVRLSRLYRYGLAVGIIAVAHGLSVLCWPTLGAATHTIALAALVIISLIGGLGPSIFATLLAGADLAYTFIPPYYSFLIESEEILFVLAFMAVAMLISSLQDRRRVAEASLRIERENLEHRVQERTGELLASQTKLKLLVSDLVTVAEREQQRIGRDLHDGIGQELTGISLFTSAMADQLRQGRPPEQTQADTVAELVRQCILHTRDLARGLSPVDLEDEGLLAALGRLAERVDRLPGVTCSFTAACTPALGAESSIHLYRIAQESMNNAICHGHARSIHLYLAGTDTAWRLEVTDDGVGFDADHAPAGMGRRLMKQRAGLIGATLDVRARPDGGTQVICSGGTHG